MSPTPLFNEDSFRFAPELFELKTQVLQVLADHDLVWMIDFNEVDVLHDVYGIEIMGIPDEDTAKKILSHLSFLHASFTAGSCKGYLYEDYSGWKVEASRDPHMLGESWKE